MSKKTALIMLVLGWLSKFVNATSVARLRVRSIKALGGEPKDELRQVAEQQ